MRDLRDEILQSVREKTVTACIMSDGSGIVAGTSDARHEASQLGLIIEKVIDEGTPVNEGDEIIRFRGRPKQVVMAEDVLIGLMAKPSGIATAAQDFVKASEGKLRIVCGAWKKMPPQIKNAVRNAVVTGGAFYRICQDPVIYLDKNYIEIHGGIKKSLEAVKGIEGHKKVVQLKGRYWDGDIVREAWEAIEYGADILFVDTGRIDDVKRVVDHVRPVSEQLYRSGKISKLEIVFGGGIQIKDMANLKELDIDALDVGRHIVDAPILDMRMEVVDSKHKKNAGVPKYDLLDKSELRIEAIKMEEVNLTEVAEVVADTIGVDRDDVMVIDVREDVLSLDILKSNVNPHVFLAKKDVLLRKIAVIHGVEISEKTTVTSKGMLGWIAMNDGVGGAELRDSLLRGEDMTREIRKKISKRMIVFSSGIEVETGQIEDTNTPMIAARLEQEGFTVTKGPTLKDDKILFAGMLRQALERGYGVIITTGGVGAEDKDHSVEAILRLDPEAATPYLVKFEVGTGRHHKDGIRIGVGQVGEALLIALPGPNAEVKSCLEILVKGLLTGSTKEALAADLATELRERLRDKMGHKGKTQVV